MSKEKQLTDAPLNHQLTNINVWTPDSQWIAYDVRSSSNEFNGLSIERVNVENRAVEVIYQAKDGAYVGVVTVNPKLAIRYVFIHGPEHPDHDWHYNFYNRRGVIVSASEPDRAVTLDALDITPPFTAGALRGGSHVHVFSPDGSRLSFTYNDRVLHQYNPALDLRNVGVAVPLHPVEINIDHPREYSGSYFCVLVSETTPTPVAGSDQINRAYEEGWIGTDGYFKNDGKKQCWALAFIGDTLAADGSKLAEVFVVDLPDALSGYAKQGSKPLAGTATTLPAPPAGVKQRRITYSQERRYPGVVNSPRHWLRSCPKGENIAFLMRDDYGVVQLWLVSPNGGEPRQVTDGSYSICSAFSWSPDGRQLAFVMDNSIVTCDAVSGVVNRLTERSAKAPLAEAVVFSPDGRQIAFMREVDGFSQIFCVANWCLLDNSLLVD